MSPVKVTDQWVAPKGLYKVKFGGFTTRDEGGDPTAKATNQGLRIFSRLLITEGEFQGEDVPLGCDLEEGLSGWCFLFSGLPPQDEELKAIEQQMKTDKVLEVRVNERGFCQGPNAKGTQIAKFVRFSKRDENSGQPVLGMKEFQGVTTPTIYWNFQIVAGDLQGVVVPGSCPYRIRQKGNEMELASSTVMYSWCSICGVDWTNVPDFADPENALPELEEIMQRANVLLTIQINEESGWIASGQTSVSSAPAGVTVTQTKEPVAEKRSGKAAPKSNADKGKGKAATAKAPPALSPLERLLVTIQSTAEQLGYVGAMVENRQLTEIGKQFAVECMAPICEANTIPRGFARMTEANMEFLIVELGKLGTDEEGGGDEF